MTYQRFEEMLQRVHEITPERQAGMRVRWQSISHRGLLFYTVTRGALLFAWMLLCWLFFAWRFGTLHVITQGWVLASELPVLLLLSFALPWTAYFILRRAIDKLNRQSTPHPGYPH